MNKIIHLALGTFLLALSFSAEAQQAKKVPRIGYVTFRAGTGPSGDSLRDGLRELGYTEGQSIIIEWRSAEGQLDRIPGILADFVSGKVDVIVVSSVQAAQIAKKTTQTIPIVFATADDPVATGLVASFAQPGGNVTGITDLAQHLSGKRVELLKETVPKVSRLGLLLWNPAGPGYASERIDIESAAGALGVRLQSVELRRPHDLEDAFSAMIRAGANAFMGLTDTRFGGSRERIAQLSIKHRLPAVYPDRAFVEAGGLMSYATNRAEWRRRVAYYVDKILKGAKPADLPVEQPMKFELVINLKTAKQIGLTIPPNVLARADRVIR